MFTLGLYSRVWSCPHVQALSPPFENVTYQTAAYLERLLRSTHS
jgi:hypothetical protein